MRETHTVQTSMFDFYSKHEQGLQLKTLSKKLDEYPEILELVEEDLIRGVDRDRGRNSLSAESVFRCMVLKQMLGVSYKLLSFHLSDSLSYRAFARLRHSESPSKSTLQNNIRKIRPVTLSKVFDFLARSGYETGEIDPKIIRIDSTVVKSNIAPPSDSKLLNDGVRLLSRSMAKSKEITGVKIRFKDWRIPSKKLAFQIFSAKKHEKDELYVDLLTIANKVIKQVEEGIDKIKRNADCTLAKTQCWLDYMENNHQIMLMVIDQTERRVIEEEEVPATEKVVSFFELHTDIIVKDKREVQYGHKINVASDVRGLLTHLSIEEGNAADVERYIPILRMHEMRYGTPPETAAADGGYASQDNVSEGKGLGVKQVVFHKKNGINLKGMGVKQKTFYKLKKFRAGIEGNISTLKRAFGLGKATWQGYEGFHAYVWASAITYNLTKMSGYDTG